MGAGAGALVCASATPMALTVSERAITLSLIGFMGVPMHQWFRLSAILKNTRYSIKVALRRADRRPPPLGSLPIAETGDG